MDLLKINPSLLKRAVAEVEYPNAAESFESLCKDIADGKWGSNLGLDGHMVEQLIFAHNIDTKVKKPEKPVETEEVEVATTPETPSAGRGRKTCPNCQKIVGVRTAECPFCQHEFYERVTPKSTGPSPNSAGQGKKYCPNCKEIVGARSAECKHCQHEFYERVTPKPTGPSPNWAGQGKKYCPKCNGVIGIRSAECSHCEHKFYERVTPKPVDNGPLTSEGPGRKRCPSCDKIVGARSAVCKYCEHEFVKAETPASVKVKLEAPKLIQHPPVEGVKVRSLHVGVPRTFVPSGKCPHKLEGTSYEEVREWAEKIRDTGLSNRENRSRELYLCSALVYWVREFYPMLGVKDEDGKIVEPIDYHMVVEHLTTLYPNEAER